jgi:hypothetical protein
MDYPLIRPRRQSRRELSVICVALLAVASGWPEKVVIDKSGREPGRIAKHQLAAAVWMVLADRDPAGQIPQQHD